MTLGACGLIGGAKSVTSSVVSTDKDVHDTVATANKVKKVGEKITNLGEKLTPENEYYVGRSVATNILAKHDYKYHDAADLKAGKLSGLTLYVNQVGSYLAAVANERPPAKGDRPAPIAGYHFVVLDNDSINAFPAPGGSIFVPSGAVKLARNEDQLAAVLAHEIAHVRRGHALGSIQQSRYADLTTDVLDASGALSPEQLGQLSKLMEGAIDDMIKAYFEKGYSKETEFEADQLGLEIMAGAGYDPTAFVSFLGELKKHADTGKGGFYATHPSADDRIAKLNDHLKDVTGGKLEKARTQRFMAATRELR